MSAVLHSKNYLLICFARNINCLGHHTMATAYCKRKNLTTLVSHFCHLKKCVFLNSTLGDGRFLLASYFSSENKNLVCWKCMEKSSQTIFFCDKCQVIQKPNLDINYFELFDLKRSFDINEEELSNRLKKIQKLIHPDMFSLKSPEEIAIAEEYSSLLNEAYSALRRPWSRAVYLLKSMGVDVEVETTLEDPQLLMTVVERNEDLVAAKDKAALLDIDRANKEDIAQVVEKLSEAFKLKDVISAKNLVYKLKYFSNIDVKIRDKKVDWNIVD